jgi:hypothetical protein
MKEGCLVEELSENQRMANMKSKRKLMLSTAEMDQVEDQWNSEMKHSTAATTPNTHSSIAQNSVAKLLD